MMLQNFDLVTLWRMYAFADWFRRSHNDFASLTVFAPQIYAKAMLNSEENMSK
jgi:hypothetical protein